MSTAASSGSALPPRNGGWYWLAELGCLALGLALAASTLRLFVGTEPVAVMAGVAVGAWALAIALRRSPLPTGVAEVVHLGVGFILLLVVIAPETRFGPLPTIGSLGDLYEVIRDDFSAFNDDIAPMDPRSGHMAVLGVLIWALALFCSSTAMRLRAPVQAAIPHVVAILALGLVAREQARIETTVALVVAVSTYCLSQQAWRNSAFRWLPATRHTVARQAGAGAAVLGVSAVLAAIVVPLSPVDVDPALDLRQGGLGDGGPRTVVSPFVEVGSYLGPRGNEVLFEAQTSRPGYWRLTSLDTYDPAEAIWVLSNSYAPVRGPLSAPPDAGTYGAEVSIAALGGIWVPTPDDPVEAEASFQLNWDSASASLISRGDDLGAGDVVIFAAAATELTAAELSAATAAPGTPTLLEADGSPEALTAMATDLTAGLGDFESALALQQFFRSDFTYDETANYSGAEDPMSEFLEARSGFCQQFSTAFALAARSIGLPTRVVVGFTPGEPTADDSTPDGDVTSVQVSGRNAHAWPEVLFDEYGLVSFEPTPGRGDPATTAVTGVPGQQADPPAAPVDPATSEPAPVDTTPSTIAPVDPPGTAQAEGGQAADQDDADDDNSGGNWIWVVLVLSAMVLVGAGLAARARTRSAGRATGVDPVMDAWMAALAELDPSGLEPANSETPLEFSDRVQHAVASPSLGELALLESARRWSPLPTTQVDRQDAQAALQRLSEELLAGAGSAHPPPD